jgi:hypothetical protein
MGMWLVVVEPIQAKTARWMMIAPVLQIQIRIAKPAWCLLPIRLLPQL